MAPKRPVKPKKEEAIEVPKTSSLPDGQRVHFIGGWSMKQSISALAEITKDPNRQPTDKIYLLPGEYADGNHVIPVRTLAVEGITLTDLAEPAPAAAHKADPDAEGGDAPAEDAEAAPAAPVEPVVDRSVAVNCGLTFEAWTPPVEVKAPEPPPVEEKKEPAKPAAKAGSKDKKKAVVIEEEVAPPPVVEAPPPVGANPAEWPIVTFRKICFGGPVVTKGVHLVFEECHFDYAGGHQLSVHQYCEVKLQRCTFSKVTRGSVYAYPLANVVATDCTFTGTDLYVEQQAALAPADVALTAAVAASTSSARACTSSVGLFIDNANVTATKCRFRQIAIGVLLHDKAAQTLIAKCDFDRIFNMGCLLDGTHATLKSNTLRRCEYYALRAKGKTAAKVLNNIIDSKVLVERGAAPLLFGNTCAVRLLDENDTGNAYMEPSY